MMTNPQKFPLWFTAITALYFVTNLAIFGIATLVSPGFAFPDMAGTPAEFPIQFFAVRHIAFAFPLLFGLIRRNVTVLTTMYSIFIVMAVLDVSLLILNGYYIPVIGDLPTAAKIIVALGGFITPVSLCLWYLTARSPETAST